MKTAFKYFILFSVGGLLYMLLEIWYSNHTHWTMGLLGGICFILIGLIDSYYDLPLYKQMILSTIIITSLEFAAGTILNLILKLNLWDYSTFPLNILGQVCLPFSALWFLISLPAILLDDWIRYTFFGETKYHYKFF
ncbi:MAG: hypothetical protein J6F30_12400 [Cellulosilyticum sp.]|nr:hypothetical protein [Cellulosilyticum sp.]